MADDYFREMKWTEMVFWLLLNDSFKANMSNAFLYSMNSTLKEGARGFKTHNEIFQNENTTMQIYAKFFIISIAMS